MGTSSRFSKRRHGPTDRRTDLRTDRPSYRNAVGSKKDKGTYGCRIVVLLDLSVINASLIDETIYVVVPLFVVVVFNVVVGFNAAFVVVIFNVVVVVLVVLFYLFLLSLSSSKIIEMDFYLDERVTNRRNLFCCLRRRCCSFLSRCYLHLRRRVAEKTFFLENHYEKLIRGLTKYQTTVPQRFLVSSKKERG